MSRTSPESREIPGGEEHHFAQLEQEVTALTAAFNRRVRQFRSASFLAELFKSSTLQPLLIDPGIDSVVHALRAIKARSGSLREVLKLLGKNGKPVDSILETLFREVMPKDLDAIAGSSVQALSPVGLEQDAEQAANRESGVYVEQMQSLDRRILAAMTAERERIMRTLQDGYHPPIPQGMQDPMEAALAPLQQLRTSLLQAFGLSSPTEGFHQHRGNGQGNGHGNGHNGKKGKNGNHNGTHPSDLSLRTPLGARRSPSSPFLHYSLR